MEDSDGISVISESEMCKNNSNNSDGEVEKPNLRLPEPEDDEEQEDGDNEESDEFEDNSEETTIQKSDDFCADDSEPMITALKKYQENVVKEIDTIRDSSKQQQHAFPKNNQGFMLLIGVSLIIAILYTNVTSLKNELAKTASIYEQRIARLEQENQLLKSQLDDLMWRLKKSDSLSPVQREETPQESSNDKIKYRAYMNDQEPKVREPATKKVWLGGEKEEVVKILDKKYNSLPNYCYHTDEDDLFYEYNKENCERKKQKLDERIKKLNAPHTADEMWNTKMTPDYKDFMDKTTDELLQSLNDEIQEIKKSRHTMDVAATLEKADKNAPTKEPIIEETRGKSKRKNKRQPKQRGDSPNEWDEKRSYGREAAREKLDTGSAENWYLKRQNDRELHRLGATHD
jgi:hypothetical protein